MKDYFGYEGKNCVVTGASSGMGKAVCKMLVELGAKVYGLTRTKHDLPDYLEDIYTFDKIDDVLADKDVIALSLPETEQTKHLFNYERLHQLKQGAMIINVGRGSAIVTKDRQLPVNELAGLLETNPGNIRIAT